MIHRIRTIDSHTAGEPLRLVIDGLPAPEGRTMLEKRAWAQKQLDHLRRAIMLEPRGHADMYGALLTEPVTPDGHAGVLFMHNEGWSTMCGHGIIAVTTIAIERGLIWSKQDGKPPTVQLRYDTPAGRVEARANVTYAATPSRVDRWRSATCRRSSSSRRCWCRWARPQDARRRRLRRRVLRHRRRRSRGPAD